MPLEFYYFDYNAPSRVIWMVLKALGLEYEGKIVNVPKKENQTPEFLAVNPKGTIPCVRDGDYVITESRAVCAYICNQYEKGDDDKRLYPVDPKRRGRVDQILYESGKTDNQIRAYANIDGVMQKNEMPRADKLDEVKDALKTYEDYLTKHKFIADDHLTLADYYMLSSILLLGFTNFQEMDSYPKTKEWLALMKKLPYYDECNEAGVTAFGVKYQKAMGAGASGGEKEHKHHSKKK